MGGVDAGVAGFAQGFIDAWERKQNREDRLKETSEDRALRKLQLEMQARQQGLLIQDGGIREDEGFYDRQRQRKMDDMRGLIPLKIEEEEAMLPYELQKIKAKGQVERDNAAAANPYKGLMDRADFQKRINDIEQDALKSKDEKQKRTVSPIKDYAKTDDAPLDATDARMLKGAVSDKNKFLKTLGNVKNKTKELSSISAVKDPVKFYNKRKELMSAVKQLQLDYKSKSFADLGVLAGPDVGFIEQVVENPTSDVIFGNTDAVLSRFDELEKNTEASFDDKFAQYGLVKNEKPGLMQQPPGLVQEPPQGMIPQQAAPPQPPQGDFVWVMDKTGHKLKIPRSRLQEALADGAAEVQ